MFPSFVRLVNHPVKFRLFLLTRLPAAFFSGVRIKSLEPEKSEVVVPYGWFTTNPFRSTYFACLSMAAEMSTGALAMGHLYKRKPAVSMLITASEGKYFKKATGVSTFSCNDGSKIEAAIKDAIVTGLPVEVTAVSTGKNTLGETIATFSFTWSFKIKVSQG